MGGKDSKLVYHSVAKTQCALLTVCTIRMSPRTQSSADRRHNERVVRWNNIVRNSASRKSGRMILINLELELRALAQARFTTDGIQFDSIEGEVWNNCLFHERLDEIEVELFGT